MFNSQYKDMKIYQHKQIVKTLSINKVSYNSTKTCKLKL